MTIGGHSYISGNYTPQGNFVKFSYDYDTIIKGFSIPVKYAQVALC
jgi:hypothetical protein